MKPDIDPEMIALCYPSSNSILHVFQDSKLLLNDPMDIKEIRRQHFLATIAQYETLEELAEKAHANPKHLSQLKNGTRGIGDKFARKMEAALGLPRGEWDHAITARRQVTNDGTHQNTSLPIKDLGMVPLISFVRAGDLCDAEDPYQPGDAERWIPACVTVSQGMYALRVEGDSMVNPYGSPSITDGMIIIVDPSSRPTNGSLVVARDGNGKATFKKLQYDGDAVFLVPLNPRYPPIPITDELHICGVVVAAQVDLR